MKKLLLVTVLTLAATTALAALASAASPSVRFVTPSTGTTTSSTVVARVALANFALDPADVGKTNKLHRGHLHFQMDGGKYDYPEYSGPNGQLAKTLGIAGKYSPSVGPKIIYRHLPAGKHTLTVFLANNDHSAVGPKATVTFTRPVRAHLAIAAAVIGGSLAAAGGVAGAPGHAAPRPPVTVRLGEFFFRPATVTVHVGQAVRFVNVGKIQHTVADTTGGWKALRSRLIQPRPLAHGQAQTVRFTAPGTVYYLCTFHPTLMRGKVVVVP